MKSDNSWSLELDVSGVERGGTVQLGLTVFDTINRNKINLVDGCSSLDQFGAQVQHIKDRLDQILEAAASEFKKIERQSRASSTVMSAEELWRQMEAAASEQQMFSIFNALSESVRSEVAEYVFTHVNMFKGKGPIFAEHYNAVTLMLE